MAVYAKFENLEALDRMVRNVAGTRHAGVKVVGSAVDYYAVWEWGSARIHRPGPRTTWGENPDGDRVVLTLTAPHGYIRIHYKNYLQFLQEEFKRVKWAVIPMDQWPKAIDGMLYKAAERCSKLISDSAPADTGNLRVSIFPVAPGDMEEDGGEMLAEVML